MKTIKEYTIVELKALAYDELVKQENATNNIKIINQELAERAKGGVTAQAIEDVPVVTETNEKKD